MPKYVAFLRAINVGGHLVKMDHLRSLFESLGFANVETFIASGNVIFDSKSTNTKALETKIEKHLQKTLGYEVRTFVRSTTELSAIAQHEPFDKEDVEKEGHTLYIAFVVTQPTLEGAQKLVALSSDIDGFHVNDREVYWLYRRENGESKFYGQVLEKSIGMQATVRNSNTIRRLANKYCKP
jgi:uncharacterized protein (DUF1697 family)